MSKKYPLGVVPHYKDADDPTMKALVALSPRVRRIDVIGPEARDRVGDDRIVVGKRELPRPAARARAFPADLAQRVDDRHELGEEEVARDVAHGVVEGDVEGAEAVGIGHHLRRGEASVAVAVRLVEPSRQRIVGLRLRPERLAHRTDEGRPGMSHDGDRRFVVSLGGQGEMLPRYENMVSLHPTKKDKWGMPLLHIDYRIRENERKMTEHMADAVEAQESPSATAARPSTVQAARQVSSPPQQKPTAPMRPLPPSTCSSHAGLQSAGV